MAESGKRLDKVVIVKDLGDLAEKLAGGTLIDGTQIVFNGVGCTIFTDTTAPTTSTKAFSVGDVYVDTSNIGIYFCIAITIENSVYIYTWIKISTESSATELDPIMIPRRQYTLSDQSAAFNMVLPASGGSQDYIEVIFKATTAFTPTTSGGTVVGDTIPTTIANKTYSFLFCWIGNAWRFQYLGW